MKGQAYIQCIFNFLQYLQPGTTIEESGMLGRAKFHLSNSWHEFGPHGHSVSDPSDFTM